MLALKISIYVNLSLSKGLERAPLEEEASLETLNWILSALDSIFSKGVAHARSIGATVTTSGGPRGLAKAFSRPRNLEALVVEGSLSVIASRILLSHWGQKATKAQYM